MTDETYTGFGSHIVLEPQDLNLTDGDKNNANNPVSRLHNLRLRLKYFTIQACADDNHENTNLRENFMCKNPVGDVENINNECILLFKTNSCDSFHSCMSSTSDTHLSKPSRVKCEKSRHQFSITKPSEEEFHTQITMISAIFLNKKPLEDNQCKIKNEKLSSKTNASDYLVADKKCYLKSYRPSADKTFAQARINCKYPTQQNHVQETVNPTDDEEQCVVASTELAQEKFSANKPVNKTFKINRKSIYGTKKPFMSKIIGRKGHQAMLHKLQPEKSFKINLDRANVSDDEAALSSDDGAELLKGVILNVKQGISEGYEIHFFEPIQRNEYTISFFPENVSGNLISEAIHIDKNINSSIQNSETEDGLEDFEESLMNEFNKLQFSDSNFQSTADFQGTGSTVDLDIRDSREEVKEAPCYNDTNFESTGKENSLPVKQSNQENVTELNESNFSDLSLNETFKILFQNESCWLQKTDNSHLNQVVFRETLSEEKPAVEEAKLCVTENRVEDKIKIDTECNKETVNTRSKIRQPTCCRRRSSSRKSVLPVIEESPEPTQETLNSDLLESDYCLVDIRGRSIHLFDSRGFPLTDGSGRPLRSTGGELLLKCDDNGIPLAGEETPIFDMFGRQPHEEGFQPWMSPHNSCVNRLTLDDGRPLVLFDVEGKPLTSISGTLLVDSAGRNLLKLQNCYGHLSLNR